MPAATAPDPTAIEQLTARAWGDVYVAPSLDVRARLRLSAQACDTALVLRSPALPVPLFNRALGAGVAAPASEDLVQSLVGRFRTQGIAGYFVHVSSAATPAGPLRAWLARAGLTRYHRRWIQMARGADAAPPSRTDLRIEPMGPGRGSAFARLLTEGFALPPAIQPVLAALVARPGWHAYAAFDGEGEEPVAAAAMFVDAALGGAYLAFAATRLSHRGRGGQGALMSRRIADALALGCRFLVTETGEEIPDAPSPSLHNMLRCGFRPAALVENWCPPGTTWGGS